jgi:sulfite dehydrogenase (cytochrome) subunit B
MSRFHVLAIALVAAASGTVVALGAESDIKLKPGTGLDVVQGNCAACHSLDYIVINSPFLDAPGWQAEVTKMVNAFGAPIEKADQDKIAAYLATNYAK